jgi:acetylornithine deacetylase/succinyl-diaminopimelate desuccinylase-like protein
LVSALHAAVPSSQAARLAALADELGDPVLDALPLLDGFEPHGATATDRLLAQAWGPAMAVTGMDGIPPVGIAGNVLRASTTAKLSFRLPPSVDAEVAVDALVEALSANPPHGATVTVTAPRPVGNGWVCPDPAPWLRDAIDAASMASFGRPAGWTSEGGSIPFLAQLGQRFPGLTILATGALGPGSNAHGPDESLHLECAQHVTESLAHLLVAAASNLESDS